MLKFITLLCCTTLLAISSFASANVITTDVFVTESDKAGSVPRLYFTVTKAGDFSFDALGSRLLGDTFNIDPMMYIFKNDGALDSNDFLAMNDDSNGKDSHIDLTLSVGNYLIAVSEYFFEMDNVISGIDDSISDPNKYIRLSIASTNGGEVSVPAPATIFLLLMGLLMLGFSYKKSIK
ncbi:hypothetical protein PCNPT3_07815 [Psychromonas sp. CNPT3]|uniref:DVUA0089 family protein n=1 Tax=Psychromonas sp. CNPT3 TaxID=314282 RepID=UPI0002C14076|nr:DVUA0089 family protein [Psychromonas sp. CNPT3]AGH81501.1 hypothetical protein PCNPT3_07815 [Psychromonas sp. CNPT3]